MGIFIVFGLIALIVAIYFSDKFSESSSIAEENRYQSQRRRILDERSDQEYYDEKPFKEANRLLDIKLREHQIREAQREREFREREAEREREFRESQTMIQLRLDMLRIQKERETISNEFQLEKYKADRKYEHKDKKLDVKRYKIDAKVAIKGLESINFRIAQYATIATTKSDFYEKAILGRLETLKTNAEIDLNRLKTLDSMEAEKRKNRILNDIDNNLNSIHNDLNDAW
ncbi:hypothetical protein [Flectobacillus major]|uniref:hypothetical protein n=1 Tax=Flectobacillus major TaxID=103 RepID=UPI00041E55A6|nr:hypothetical protein [Flectobacillus major]